MAVPVIDLSRFDGGRRQAERIAGEVDAACREHGFFSIVGHGIDQELPARVAALSRDFFALPEAEKDSVAMRLAGSAWRGWFPLGGELTAGRPDRKEGLYFGQEHPPDHPGVRAAMPLHGSNLWPERPAELRVAVLAYLERLTALARRLVPVIALALGLPDDALAPLFRDPTILLRVFAYPPAAGDDGQWGVGEHTDYGVLTILWQDASGGLQVRAPGGWVEVEPRAEAFVCNVGDMLDRMTGGRYRSTPHRVRNTSSRVRISIPFFFDPSWDARVEPLALPGDAPPDDADRRWDAASVHDWSGTYGDYLLAKVARVFPRLHEDGVAAKPRSGPSA